VLDESTGETVSQEEQPAEDNGYDRYNDYDYYYDPFNFFGGF
jgi:serine protease Do